MYYRLQSILNIYKLLIGVLVCPAGSIDLPIDFFANKDESIFRDR